MYEMQTQFFAVLKNGHCLKQLDDQLFLFCYLQLTCKRIVQMFTLVTAAVTDHVSNNQIMCRYENKMSNIMTTIVYNTTN